MTLKAVRVQGVQAQSGICPAGRYCPKGTSEPVVCDAGKFSSSTGRTTKCVGDCEANFYCPDPGKKVQCPEHTHSGWGKASQADCKCDDGYQCVYKKRINLNIVVNVPYKTLVSSAGEALKLALLQAVAESAGVSTGNVQIEQVLPSVVAGPGQGGNRRLLSSVVAGPGQGGNRRLLSRDKTGAAMVRFSVAGAEKVEGLQERLSRRAEFRGGAKVHWRRVDNLRVLPAPAGEGKGWDLRFWRARAS